MRGLEFALVGMATALVVGLVLFVALGSDGRPTPDARIALNDLSSPRAPSSYHPDPSRIRFAVAAVLSPRATLDSYQEIVGYLSQKLGRPVELIPARTYAEVNAMVRSGDVTFALVCSGAFVLGRTDFGMMPLAVPVVRGKTTYHSYLIVPSASDAKTWADLASRTFAFSDPLSNSGRLVPLYVLYQMGYKPESFFSNFIFTYGHDKSIEAVAKGIVDAAAVDSLVYDSMVERDPSLAERTRIIWRSPGYGINPIVVHPDINPDLLNKLKGVLLQMDQDPAGRAVLARLGLDSFTTPDLDAYQQIEVMLSATGSR